MLFYFVYFHTSEGDYNVSVVLENELSSRSLWTSVPVQVTIQGFHTWLIQEYQGKCEITICDTISQFLFQLI